MFSISKDPCIYFNNSYFFCRWSLLLDVVNLPKNSAGISFGAAVRGIFLNTQLTKQAYYNKTSKGTRGGGGGDKKCFSRFF